MTVLDELATKPGNYEQTLAYIRKLGQTFSSCRGQRKATAYVQRVGQSIRIWHQNSFSSGEKTGLRMAKKIGVVLEEGTMRRFVDYPISKTIFDINGDNKPDGTDEEQVFFKKLAKGLNANHGVALPVFVEWIIKTQNLEAKFEAHRAALNDKVEVDENWQRALVDKAAVNYAGGMLGIEAGVVPRGPVGFEASMLKVCNKMLDYCATAKVDAGSLFMKLQVAIKDPMKVPVFKKGQTAKDFDPDRHLGFRRLHQGEMTTFLIGTRLDVLCGSRRAKSQLIQLLKDKGKLIGGTNSKSQPVKVPGVSGTVRCIRIKSD